MQGTLYGVLGVEQSADEDDIVRAYRAKVKTHHPDVSDAPDAREQFKRIRTAEAVLTDGDERARYDELGHETYVRRHLDTERWGVSAVVDTDRAASTASTPDAATASTATADTTASADAGQRGVRADGGTGAAYYEPGKRVGATGGRSVERLSDILLSVGPWLVAHLLLLVSTATMAAWLLLGASGGPPSLTSVVVATAMVGITGCLSLLHVTSTLFG